VAVDKFDGVLTWQGLWFEDETLAPTWEDGHDLPSEFVLATSPVVNHVFGRLQMDF